MGIDGTLMSPAPKTPSQRRSWLKTLTWEIFSKKFRLKREEQPYDMHDLLFGHEGHPMLKT